MLVAALITTSVSSLVFWMMYVAGRSKYKKLRASYEYVSSSEYLAYYEKRISESLSKNRELDEENCRLKEENQQLKKNNEHLNKIYSTYTKNKNDFLSQKEQFNKEVEAFHIEKRRFEEQKELWEKSAEDWYKNAEEELKDYKEELKIEFLEEVEAMKEEQEEKFNQMTEKIRREAAENLEQYRIKMKKEFIEDFYADEPEKEYDSTEIEEEKACYWKKEAYEIQKGVNEVYEKIKEQGWKNKEEIFGMQKEQHSFMLLVEQRHMQLEKGLIDVRTFFELQFVELRFSVNENLSKLEYSFKESKLQIEGQIKDVIHHFGKEILRLEENEMRIINTMQERFLELSTQNKNTELALKELANEYNAEIRQLGLSMDEMRFLFQNERAERQLENLKLVALLEKYNNAVQLLSDKVQLVSEKSDFRNEQAMLGVQRQLQEANSLHEQAKLLVKEGSVEQRKAFYALENSVKQIEHGLKDIALADAGKDLIMKEKENQLTALKNEAQALYQKNQAVLAEIEAARKVWASEEKIYRLEDEQREIQSRYNYVATELRKTEEEVQWWRKLKKNY